MQDIDIVAIEQLQWNTYRKSYVAYRMASLQNHWMTF